MVIVPSEFLENELEIGITYRITSSALNEIMIGTYNGIVVKEYISKMYYLNFINTDVKHEHIIYNEKSIIMNKSYDNYDKDDGGWCQTHRFFKVNQLSIDQTNEINKLAKKKFNSLISNIVDETSMNKDIGLIIASFLNTI